MHLDAKQKFKRDRIYIQATWTLKINHDEVIIYRFLFKKTSMVKVQV
jgi:hypothetical protein